MSPLARMRGSAWACKAATSRTRELAARSTACISTRVRSAFFSPTTALAMARRAVRSGAAAARSRSTAASRVSDPADDARASAMPALPSASMARRRASTASSPWSRASTAAMSSAGTRPNVSRMVRDRTVRSSASGAADVSTNTVAGGGSSSDFSRAFCAASSRASASRTSTRRRWPSNGRYWQRSSTSRTTSILILPVSSGSSAMTSTCTWRAMRSHDRQRPQASPSGDRSRQFSACASATATRHFPTPAGPANSSVAGVVPRVTDCASRASSER